MEILGYKDRIIDRSIEDHLLAFGAVCLEGPKWWQDLVFSEAQQ